MECIVCGNQTDFSIFLNAKKQHPNYWKCQGCKLVFAYPQPVFDYQNSNFDSASDFELSPRLMNYELRYDIIKKHIKSHHSCLLDVGANTGIFLYFMRSKGIKGVGLEPCAPASSYGNNRFGVDIFPTSFEKFEVGMKYDIITMLNVLEHVADPPSTLQKALNSINMNGLLILELPYIFTWNSLYSFGYGPHFHNEHIWFFNENNISKLLSDIGFKVQELAFIPKVVTAARLFDTIMSNIIYFYISRQRYLEFTGTKFYRYLNSKKIRIAMNDYFLVIAKKSVD